MRVKLTNEKKDQIFSALKFVYGAKEKRNPKFNYAISRNLQLLEGPVSAMLKVYADTTADFEKERIELCEKFARKDEAGKPITINNGANFDIAPEKMPAFNELQIQLREKHKEAFDKAEAFKKAEDETEVYGIGFDTLPDLETSAQDTLLPLITGQPEDK